MQSLKISKYLKASSLLESVIAISIISICILVASTIYLNVISQSRPIGLYNAIHKVTLLTQETIDTKNYDDGSYKFENYSINKKVIIDKDSNTVLLVFNIKTSSRKHIIKKIIPFSNE